MNEVKVLRLHHEAKLPEKKTKGAAAFDLYSVEDKVILTNDVHPIRTGLAMEIPPGYMLKIVPRSGLSTKGVFVANSPGTIDEDYRGEIKVILTTINPNGYRISKGDRIAQCYLQEIIPTTFRWADSITATPRGTNGFGSTGK